MTTEELKRLLAAATPGPWVATPKPREAVTWLEASSFAGARSGWIGSVFGTEGENAANAALIVAAVNSLPALLAMAERVEELERQLAEADAALLVSCHPDYGGGGASSEAERVYFRGLNAAEARDRAALTTEKETTDHECGAVICCTRDECGEPTCDKTHGHTGNHRNVNGRERAQ